MRYFNWLISAIMLMFMASCYSDSQPSDVNLRAVNSIYRTHGIELPKHYDLYILTEAGCVSCNQSFLNFMVSSVVNKENVFIYSTAKGTRIDISPFLTDTIMNLVEGNTKELNAFSTHEGSAFVRVENDMIDTFILIKATDLRESLAFLGRKK